MAAVTGEPFPETVEEKKRLVLSRGIALWDVIGSCTVAGSADSSIRDVVPNDLRPILAAAPIRAIYVNGRTADAYYRKYQRSVLGRDAVVLPSTSPANAACSFDRLLSAWSVLKGTNE